MKKKDLTSKKPPQKHTHIHTHRQADKTANPQHLGSLAPVEELPSVGWYWDELDLNPAVLSWESA